MTSIRVAVIVLTFVAGSVVGGGLVAYWLQHSHPNFDDLFLIEEVGKLEAALISLREIRAGNIQGAAEILEAKIDAALISLSDGEGNASLTAQQDKKDMVGRARQYRSEFPRKTDSPSVDQSVAKSLEQFARTK